MPTIRPKIIVDNRYESQTSYTIDLDLPTSGLLSTLYLIVRARTLATIPIQDPYMKNLISSISLNQAGQDALNAARPCAFQADYYYKTGKFPQIGNRRWQTEGDVEETIPILFGDKVDDPYHYIDLAKMRDPKLSITYDLATKDYAGYSLWDTSYYPRFTIIANFLEGAGIPGSLGYHSLRTLESFTPSNLEKRKVELKGGRPIKRIYLWQDGTIPGLVMHQNVSEIKLWGDNEAWVPFSMESERFKELVRMYFGIGKATGSLAYVGSTKDIDVIFEEMEHVSVHEDADQTHAADIDGGSGRGWSIQFYKRTDGLIDTSAVGHVNFEFSGIAPWGIYPIDMAKMLGMDTLDPKQHAPVHVEIDFEDSLTAAYAGPFRVLIEDIATQ